MAGCSKPTNTSSSGPSGPSTVTNVLSARTSEQDFSHLGGESATEVTSNHHVLLKIPAEIFKLASVGPGFDPESTFYLLMLSRKKEKIEPVFMLCGVKGVTASLQTPIGGIGGAWATDIKVLADTDGPNTKKIEGEVLVKRSSPDGKPDGSFHFPFTIQLDELRGTNESAIVPFRGTIVWHGLKKE